MAVYKWKRHEPDTGHWHFSDIFICIALNNGWKRHEPDTGHWHFLSLYFLISFLSVKKTWARYRALTHPFSSQDRILNLLSEKDMSPIQGIDTLKLNSFCISFQPVKKTWARYRALTQNLALYMAKLIFSEKDMSPIQGIDTLVFPVSYVHRRLPVKKTWARYRHWHTTARQVFGSWSSRVKKTWARYRALTHVLFRLYDS